MKADIIDILKFSIGTLLVAIGWVIAHYFTSKRDRRNKKRDISIEHLIKVYRILTHEISHRVITSDKREKLEEVITDIQLFGSEEQIELAKQLAADITIKNVFELDPLINCLRNDLRKQIGLENISGNVKWVRL